MNRYTALGAALILAASTAVFADSAPEQQRAHVPQTPAAKRAGEVLARAERAFTLYMGKQQVSNVWFFPTGDENTVFVKYDLTPGAASSTAGAKVQSRLAVLEMQGDRIARLYSLEPLEQVMVAKR